MYKIGFFPQFNGADSVLLAGTPKDIAELSRKLEMFVASSNEQLPIHTLGLVSKRHPVELMASGSDRGDGFGYQWFCSPDEFETIQGNLEPFTAESASGHQYFKLVQPGVQWLFRCVC
jgi:hypothetical protein